MPVRIVQVDAFTGRPFGGNPAAVVVLPEAASEEWMRNVALEMNLSETAFLVERGDGSYDLRWFTPSVEIDLCGHATVASAHVLWQEGHLPVGVQARFHTRSGLLTADREGDWIELNFPAKLAVETDAPPELLPALGVQTARYIGKNAFDYLVELESEAAVRALRPDHTRLAKLPVRGVMVTARGEGEYDFVSRFFAPGSGIDEDPVTGSAHTALGPYWAGILGKTEFLAYQASPRGGVLRVKLAGDRVLLGGQAVTVMTADFLV